MPELNTLQSGLTSFIYGWVMIFGKKAVDSYSSKIVIQEVSIQENRQVSIDF